jgi:type VI secretion system secreted protein VgrG
MRDALAILDLDVRTRVFRDQTELDVVKTVLSQARRANPGLAAMFDIEVETALGLRDYPVRRQITQHNESTGAFVRRLLRRRGVSWFFRPGRCGDAHDAAGSATAMPAHTMMLFQEIPGVSVHNHTSARYGGLRRIEPAIFPY